MSKGTILVTGGAGFIGSNFARHAISSGYKVITLDALTYAGNVTNLIEINANSNHQFVEGSITDGRLVRELLETHQPTAVLNFAAETHVDRSIDGPGNFIESNIVGVYTLLEAARDFLTRIDDTKRHALRFLHVSTDEVYGTLDHDEEPFNELNQFRQTYDKKGLREEYMEKSPERYSDSGPIAAKFVETLQRSNEQLVKIASLVYKKDISTQNNGLSEDDKKNLFDIINQGDD